MSVRLGNVTFDCADPVAVSAFWAEVLEKRVDPDGTPDFQSIGRKTGSPAYLFVQVPEGKEGKNRVHLDLRTDDLEAEVARLVGIGATIAEEHQEWGFAWTVLRDVEGNEFCVGRF